MLDLTHVLRKVKQDQEVLEQVLEETHLVHIHMSPLDAQRLGVRDGASVKVMIDSNGRDLIFGEVAVRLSPEFALELHLDTDDANAAGVDRSSTARLIREKVRG